MVPSGAPALRVVAPPIVPDLYASGSPMEHVAPAAYLAILLSAALGLYLKARQGRAALAHRDAPPAEFTGSVTLDEHRRAADYTFARMKLSGAETLLDAVLAIAWLAVLLGPLHALLSQIFAPGLTLSVAVVIAVALIDHLLHLPVLARRDLRARGALTASTARRP